MSKIRSWLAFWDFSRFSAHGDIQAVFELDPPKSVMDEIYEAEDTNRQTLSDDYSLRGTSESKPRLSRVKTRKDSIGTVAGLTEHLSDFFHEHGGTGGDVSSRLEALEEAMKRIEKLLVRLGQDLGDDASEADIAVPRVEIPPSEPEPEAADS